jgi:hypothetical protein
MSGMAEGVLFSLATAWRAESLRIRVHLLRAVLPWAAAAAALSVSATAAACPSCPSAGQVRCIVFGQGFWTNLGIGVLPFAVITAICLVVHSLPDRSALKRRPDWAEEEAPSGDAEAAVRAHDV